MSKKEQVLKQIRRDILSRKRKPGDPLSANGLEKEFPDISRSPIREAMEALAHMGLIVLTGAAGAVIRTIGDEKLHDILKGRYALQVEGSLTLASTHNLRQLEELESIQRHMTLVAPEVDCEQKARSEDQRAGDEFYELDVRFHVTTLRSAGMHEAGVFLENQMGLLRLYAGGQIDTSAVLDEHRKIVEIIEACKGGLNKRLAEKVRMAEREHLLGTARRYSPEVAKRIEKEWAVY